MNMTNRQRLFTVLEGKPVDRVPIWLLFPYHSAGYYADVRTNPDYTAIFERSKEMAVMLNRRNLGASLFEPSVTYCYDELKEHGAVIHRQSYTYRSTTLYSEVRLANGERIEKKLLANEDDLAAFAEFPINMDPAAITAELERQVPRLKQETAEFPIDYGAMMLDLGEPINFIYHSANLLEFPIWSLTQPDCMKSILDRHMERMRLIYAFCLERNLADVYFLVGSELASPPMVSRPTFQDWIVPYAKELIGMIRAYGKKSIQHYHGQIGEIIEDFGTMAPDGLHTIEAPPVGNCTLDQAFRATGNRITLIGNIQYDCFRSYSETEMEEAVKAVIDEAAGRRFILSPSAGPYEPTLSETMRRNYLTFLQAGWKYGKTR